MKLARLIAIGVILALVLSLAAACAGPGGPAPEEAMEPVQWDCMIYMAGITTFHDIEKQKAFDRIKERTGGLLDIREVPQGGLPIKAEDWAKAVGRGELGMTEMSAGYHSGSFPFIGPYDVPYLYSTKLEKRQVYEAVRPILQRELAKENIQVLFYRPAFTQALVTTKPVDPSDMGGTKIRSYSKANATQIEAMGGVAVPVAWSETYSALEKGVAEGVITGLDSCYSAKFYEICKYWYATGPLHGVWWLACTKDQWDSFPKDVQNIVYEELSQWCGLGIAYSEEEMANTWQLVEAEGCTVEFPGPEFFDMMTQKVTKPFMKEEMEKIGEPLATEVVSAIEAALGRSVR